MAQSNKDLVVLASRQLHQSNWKGAFESVSNIKHINKMTEFQSGSLRQALETRLKEVALKVFLLESQNMYTSLSISNLEQEFGLDKPSTLKQISKIIVSGSVLAQIDLDSNTVVMDRNEGNLNIDDRKEMEFLQN